MRMVWAARAEKLLLGTITLIAFGLRVYGLASQSIWYDEGLSVYYARRLLSELLTLVSSSDHPPLYFLLLHGWLRLAAFGKPTVEFLVRYPSVIFGVVLVPLVYVFGQRLLSKQAGLIAAGLIAISPFHVWYSQETRMYTLVTSLTFLATHTLWSNLQLPTSNLYPPISILQSPSSNNRTWLIYTLITALALYTHFYAGLILLAHAVFVTGWAWRSHRWRTWVKWVVASAAAVLIFLPWGGMAAGQLRANDTYWRGTLDLGRTIFETARAFAVGETLDGVIAVIAAGIYFLVAGISLLAGFRPPGGRRQQSPYIVVFAVVYVLTPMITLLAISYNRPKFAPRYLLTVLPALALLVGWGVEDLRHQRSIARQSVVRRILAAALMLALAATSGFSLWQHYTDEHQFKSDWQAAGRYIHQHAKPHDAVVIVAGHAMPAFDFYNTRHLDVYPIPPRLLPTVSDPVESADVTATLNRVKQQGHDRVWLILWQEPLADPRRLTLSQLFENGCRLGITEGFHNLAMLLFELPPDTVFGPLRPSYPFEVVFGDKLQLEGYDLWPDAVAPGETLTLRLYWHATVPVPKDYTAFTQLLSPGDEIVGQHDRRLGGDLYPTSHWPVGEPVRETYKLTVVEDTPPGRYRLIAGVYLPAVGTRLPVTEPASQRNNVAGDHVVIADVEILSGS